MKKTGTANLPLHTGKAPKWLFSRMVRLSSAITHAIALEYSQKEILRRLSNPYWFQSLSCVIGYDWHSSGTTTVTCGALKQALSTSNLGIFAAGGKGKTSRKTLSEIKSLAGASSISTARTESLQYASRMSAKVDSAVVQDTYSLYHHCFFFSEKGHWAVVQQGMNPDSKYARRYHWLSENIDSFVEEPHSAICSTKKQKAVLDMSSLKNKDTRKLSLDIIKDNPKHLQKYLRQSPQTTLQSFTTTQFTMMPRHEITDMHAINLKTLQQAYEIHPKTYEELVSIRGIGPKAIRSLALISEIIYGSPISWQDPAKYSFAHGGKDSIPYPVDKTLMDFSSGIIENAISEAKIHPNEKSRAILKLKQLSSVF